MKLVLALANLALVPSAWAGVYLNDGERLLDDPLTRHSLHAAESWWDGAYPDCDEDGVAVIAADLGPHRNGAAARSNRGECRIWLNTRVRQSAEAWCNTIAHEYGHLLGHKHTHDGGLMDPLRTDRLQVPECYELVVKGQRARFARTGSRERRAFVRAINRLGFLRKTWCCERW
jgi:hypothetical protein